ncbi:MAG TPA: tRNA (N6-isopentenyl adenosine(37)-C2)-methylthiotransferase MiaB [Desulfatiglandales bacterium]|nr:tRNA (N6-isopentenyl adenosine(37)-C2)-methylthiotransferase MiaB [Desulfatiglandales bacterium]
MRRFYIATMGCQMNEYDSDCLGQQLMNYGFNVTDNHEDADLIMINTCTVRAKAQQKAFSLIGRMISIKKRRPDIILGIMGCIAQQEGMDLFKKFPDVDLVLGTREIGRVPQILDRIIKGNEKVVATDLSIKCIPRERHNGYFKNRIKSFISIMEGCNNFCSYCIVPYVRGREVSRSTQEIMEEAKSLVSQGIKEITLLGQNVNSYSSTEREEVDFPILLRMLSGLDGLNRIRFTTSHPKDLSDDLISCFKELHVLCPHIHLPFQSGSDRILRMMNRGYSREQYIDLTAKLRDIRSDFAITSDVMVGFPGESEKDFQMTIDLIRRIEFDNLFSFKYSDRKGTYAENMAKKVDEHEKSSRLSILQSIQKEITLKRNIQHIGKEEEVLVEGESRKGGQLTGRNETNKIVNFYSDIKLIGSLVKVFIKQAFINSLQGALIKSH